MLPSELNDPLFGLVAFLASKGLIEVHAARGEFACNSSSSHSVILLPESAPTLSDDIPEPGVYGSSFKLFSSTEKLRYLAALLAEAGHSKESDLLRTRVPLAQPSDIAYGSGDIAVPSGFLNSLPEGFAQDFSEFLSSPRVALIAAEYFEPEDIGISDASFFNWPHGENWSARRDVVDGVSWWVLFHESDGTKLRISFDTFNSNFTPSKAQFPELVDVKLTDRCPFELECGFCYMGSTRAGAHAEFEKVSMILASLASMGVFEVAFGGGEPTLWPHFADAVALCASLGIKPNFTTKNFKILSDEKLFEKVGAVACSVTDRRTFDRLKTAVDKASAKDRFFAAGISIQLIPDILDESLIEEVFEYAQERYMRVTLLGYKETGRGGSFDRTARSSDFWVPIARRYKNLRLSMDTLMASKCKPTLDSLDVPRWSYHLTEGSFSMYVDAVSGYAAPSSFSTDSHVGLRFDDTLTDQIAAAFKGF